MEKSVLIIPGTEKGRGGGHLVRCLKLVQELRFLERDAYLFLGKGNTADAFNIDSSLFVSETEIKNKVWNYIILDRFQTASDELIKWKQIAPVIGIDEGGKSRDSFDFLIDILPNIEKVRANINKPSLLITHTKKDFLTTEDAKKKIKILISFGHEDEAELGQKIAATLSKINDGSLEIYLLKGSLNSSHCSLPIVHCSLLESIPNLAEHLHEYDLIFTHYGITAFEALYAGTPVILVNPTSYHEKLAKTAGFKTISLKKIHIKAQLKQRFGRRIDVRYIFLLRINSLKKHCKKLAKRHELKKPANLAVLLNSFSPQVNKNCPVCGVKPPPQSIARFSKRTYRRCKTCGIIYMDKTNPPPIEYQREYFFEFYKKQYGKTYIEDFPNLILMSKKRLKIIKNLIKQQRTQKKENSTPHLLDIGCAYGPFLAAAQEEGFFPCGIDPSVDAVNYVKENLNIPAVQGFFPDCNQQPLSTNNSLLFAHSSFDIITLWYVIEHFQNCASVLEEIRKLLKPNGILAFSTPSFSGISGKKNFRSFMKKSPADHFTVWSPVMCKKALALAGFKVKKIVNCGHHPQRFPLFGVFAKTKKSPLYWLLFAVSKIFALGDTFEVYGVKVR